LTKVAGTGSINNESLSSSLRRDVPPQLTAVALAQNAPPSVGTPNRSKWKKCARLRFSQALIRTALVLATSDCPHYQAAANTVMSSLSKGLVFVAFKPGSPLAACNTKSGPGRSRQVYVKGRVLRKRRVRSRNSSMIRARPLSGNSP